MGTKDSRTGDWLIGLFFVIFGLTLTISSWVFEDAQNRSARGIVLFIAIAAPGVIDFGLTFWLFHLKQFALTRTGNGYRGGPRAFTACRILGVAIGFLNASALRGWHERNEADGRLIRFS